MNTGILEKPETTLIEEVDKKELCKKLCLNIYEGLLEGYEGLKEKNPALAEKMEVKINELKSEMDRQKSYI